MTFRERLSHELKAVGLVTLFFGVWIGALIVLKTLVLAEYQIGFAGWSKALVGALVLAKVVLVLEHVSLGAWVRTRPAWVGVGLRTALYALGVFVVLVVEKAFEGRQEHGGFIAAMTEEFRHAEAYHVWVNTLCLSGALLAYNVLSVIRQHLGEGALVRLFLLPLSEVPGAPQVAPRAAPQVKETDGG